MPLPVCETEEAMGTMAGQQEPQDMTPTEPVELDVPPGVQDADAFRRDLSLDAVLEFRVPEDELVSRLKGRGRADDTEDVIRNRFNVYRDETAPLLDYYSENLVTEDAVGELDEVFSRALTALGR